MGQIYAARGKLEKARYHWKRAYEEGNYLSPNRLCLSFAAEGRKKESDDWLEKAAHSGNTTAQYEFGKNQHDLKKKLEWFKKAARKNPWAQLALAEKFKGMWERKNLSSQEAKTWFGRLAFAYYKKAEENHLQEAKAALVACYKNGCGVPRSPDKAKEITELLAQQQGISAGEDDVNLQDEDPNLKAHVVMQHGGAQHALGRDDFGQDVQTNLKDEIRVYLALSREWQAEEENELYQGLAQTCQEFLNPSPQKPVYNSGACGGRSQLPKSPPPSVNNAAQVQAPAPTPTAPPKYVPPCKRKVV